MKTPTGGKKKVNGRFHYDKDQTIQYVTKEVKKLINEKSLTIGIDDVVIDCVLVSQGQGVMVSGEITK